jgi:hypothetical protein
MIADLDKHPQTIYKPFRSKTMKLSSVSGSSGSKRCRAVALAILAGYIIVYTAKTMHLLEPERKQLLLYLASDRNVEGLKDRGCCSVGRYGTLPITKL